MSTVVPNSGKWTVEHVSEQSTGWRGVSIKDGNGLHIANIVMQLDDGEMKIARQIVDAVNALEPTDAQLIGMVCAYHNKAASHFGYGMELEVEAMRRALRALHSKPRQVKPHRSGGGHVVEPFPMKLPDGSDPK